MARQSIGQAVQWPGRPGQAAHLRPEVLYFPLHSTRHSVQQVVVRLLAHGCRGVDNVGQRLSAKVEVTVCGGGSGGGRGGLGSMGRRS